MAKSVVYVTTCDQPHDGGERVTEGVITIEFGYEGKTYATELCPEHQTEYHNWMQDYLTNNARVTSGGRGRAAKAGGAAKAPKAGASSEVGAIREWALANGQKVSTRGRIPADVRAAYEAAH